MLFNIEQLKQQYNRSKQYRELWKWVFAIGTFGLGGLYLWLTTKIIQEGEIGLRQTATGKMELLPSGRHSNFPWESYPVDTQRLSEKVIKMGPYKIITVDVGYVAKTFNKGKLDILPVGQHIISDASHTFEGMIPVKQETKKLHEVIASTSDNVSLTMQADVRYQIEDPATAIANIDDIEGSIKEIAEINISQIVSNHSLSDFAPATSNTNFSDYKYSGIGNVIVELRQVVTEQLAKIGIKLINIGITSWEVNDKSLAHELAQGAVVKSQTQSRLMAAKNAAKVKRIEVKAEANAIVARVTAEARAVGAKGMAYREVAENFKDFPGGQAIYQLALQCDMILNAKNPNLFFSQTPLATNNIPPLITTIPAVPSFSQQ